MEAIKKTEEALKTVTLPYLYEMAKREPIKIFDDWPIMEIRLKCLKAMENREVYENLADWAEERIRGFLKTCIICSENDEFLKALLGWYVFNAQKDTVVRAIEFSLSLMAEKKCILFFENTISKIVVNRLFKGRGTDIYSGLTSLPTFLAMLLEKLYPFYYQMRESNYQYSESDWIYVERALRIIAEYKDFSFLSKIEELILFFQARRIVSPTKPFYAKTGHLAILKEVRKILLKAKKDSLLVDAA